LKQLYNQVEVYQKVQENKIAKLLRLEEERRPLVEIEIVGEVI
jgi:hypothetical protein